MEASSEVIIRKFGCIHKAIHGDGKFMLSRILQTCEEMLEDRGYTTVERAGDILKAIQMNNFVIHASGNGKKGLNVYLHSEERVGVKFARHVLEMCTNNGEDAIVVSSEGPTPFTRKECDSKVVQFMFSRNMCYNVTRHALVPKHERVNEAPYNTSMDKLPKILDTDSIVQYYNWPEGTVVRVERCFGGHEPIFFYRVVVCTSSS